MTDPRCVVCNPFYMATRLISMKWQHEIYSKNENISANARNRRRKFPRQRIAYQSLLKGRFHMSHCHKFHIPNDMTDLNEI